MTSTSVKSSKARRKAIAVSSLPGMVYALFLTLFTVMFMVNAGGISLRILSESNLKYLYLILLGAFVIVFAIDAILFKRMKTLCLFGILVAAVITVSVVMHRDRVDSSLPNVMFNHVLWIVFFLSGLYCFSFGPSLLERQALCIFYPLLTIALYFACDYFVTPPTSLSVNAVYFVVAAIPFALCIKRKWIKFPILVLQLVAPIATKKLGAFSGLGFALVACLAVFLVYKLGIKKTLLIGLGVVVLAGAALFVVAFVTHLDLIGMINSAANGRIELYMTALTSFLHSGPLRIVIGNGYNGVSQVAGLTAHSDFIEILYDYGIVGFGVYLLALFCLLKYAHCLFRVDRKQGYIFVFSVFLFIGISMFSHLIFISKYFYVFLFYWAATIGNAKTSFRLKRLFRPLPKRKLRTTSLNV